MSTLVQACSQPPAQGGQTRGRGLLAGCLPGPGLHGIARFIWNSHSRCLIYPLATQAEGLGVVFGRGNQSPGALGDVTAQGHRAENWIWDCGPVVCW